MNQLSPETREMLYCIHAIAADTLERKRRLGDYAVIWQDGKPVLVGENAPCQPSQKQVDDQEEK